MEVQPKPKSGCQCDTGEKIVLACSGAADVGYLSDAVARELSRNKKRKMNCLALVGAAEQKVIEKMKQCNILVIDGCDLDCGRKVMEQADITNYRHIRLTDRGYIKGQTPTNAETVKAISKELTCL